MLVDGNIITKILPFKGNLATPEGPCIKGLSYIERTHSAERIIFPLIRGKNGKFHKIGISEALGLAAETLASIKEEFGPQSILWYRGSGMSGLTNEIGTAFWKQFGGATTTYGNLCWPAGLEAVRLTLGTVKHNVPWDIENANTIIIWGKNPAQTNIQEIAFISRARDNGSRVIVIDPLRTPTADKSDILISPRPGTDGALALAAAKILIDEDMIDKNFIEKYVSGFDEFKKSLRISPSDAEIITGIPQLEIARFARTIGSGGNVTFLPGYGLQRYSNGGQTVRSILSLAIITGNIGKKGSGFNYANLQSYIFDEPKEPLSYYPEGEKEKPFRRSVSMARLGKDMLEAKMPELKAIWVERANPMLQSPDSNSVRKAFSGLKFRLVVEQFMTDTASAADLILPAKDIFEQSDIIGSYWSPYVQFKPKVIDSPGEVMPESEIYFHLARRLDFKADEKQIPSPGNDNIEKWIEERIKGYSALTLEDLKKGPVIAPGLQEIAYDDFIFKTPSGKIELFSAEAVERWGISPLPVFVPLDEESQNEKFPLLFLSPNAGNRIHSQFGNLKIIRDNTDSPGVSISASDAISRGISAGDQVRIFNDTGETISKAIVSGRIPPGVVVLPNGIWLNEGGGGNFMIPGKETDIGFGSAFHGNRVEIEKI